MKTENLDKIDIINDIEKKFVNEILQDISETKKWQKNCPKCDLVQNYKNQRSLNNGIRLNAICNKCKDLKRRERTKLKKVGVKYERNCPKCNRVQLYTRLDGLVRANKRNALCKKCIFVGRPISEKQKEFLRQRVGSKNPMFGKTFSIETRMKMSLTRKGKPGKPLSESTKQKLRIYRANWVNEFAGGPQYNPNACKYFDELNKQNNWNLRHAENGGEHYIKELGYFLDAYDKEKNIVIEYDERKHFTVDGQLKQKDVIRQHQIENHLSCKFLRYNELTKQLESTGKIPIHKTTEIV